MRFNQLSFKDRALFDKFLSYKQHSLAAYAFQSIFIWKRLYKISWAIIGRQLCVFFKDRVGVFMYLPPLGRCFDADVVRRCFEIMDSYNKNRLISRIENVEKAEAAPYKELGFEDISSGRDYVCKRSALIGLSGNLFKSKRAAINYFIRNYKFEYLPYKTSDRSECVELFKLWVSERKLNNSDSIYQGLLEDNFTAFQVVLGSYNKLGFIGRVIKTGGEIKAVTVGYPLGRKTFVVLFEVCDLRFKGIAQYIFREFCKEQDYPDINIMDDSGLDSLKKVKLSYRPYKIMDSFVIRNE